MNNKNGVEDDPVVLNRMSFKEKIRASRDKTPVQRSEKAEHEIAVNKSLGMALLLFILGILFSVAWVFILTFATGYGGSLVGEPMVVPTTVVTVIGLLSSVFGLLCSTVLVNFLYSIRQVDDGFIAKMSLVRLKRAPVKSLVIGAGVGVGLFVLLQVINVLYQVLSSNSLNNSDTSDHIMNSFANSSFMMIVLLSVTSVLFAPIAEEMFFRGTMLSLINKTYPKTFSKNFHLVSAIAVSVMFAIMHFQGLSNATGFFVLLVTFLVSLCGCWLTERFDSIIPSIVMHMFYNGTTTAILLLSVAH